MNSNPSTQMIFFKASGINHFKTQDAFSYTNLPVSDTVDQVQIMDVIFS